MTIIDTASFEKRATAEGYVIVERDLGPSLTVDEHSHEFDAWGLVTAGEFHITLDGSTTVYRTGEEFKLEAGCLHSEMTGPNGATYLAGRREKD